MGATRGESDRHRELKRQAVRWAQAHAFAICGLEVRVPRSPFRADVAACALSAEPGLAGETALFECKQARADLLRDRADEAATLTRLKAVTQRRDELERLLGTHLPNLRRGDSLFAECDVYDLDTIRHDGLRAVRREEATLQRKLHGGTKFARLLRYRSADRLYLVVSEHVIAPHEVPAGWGLLELCDDALVLKRRPVRQPSDPAARLALLQAIATTGTRRLNTELNIDRDAIEAVRRGSTGGAVGWVLID